MDAIFGTLILITGSVFLCFELAYWPREQVAIQKIDSVQLKATKISEENVLALQSIIVEAADTLSPSGFAVFVEALHFLASNDVKNALWPQHEPELLDTTPTEGRWGGGSVCPFQILPMILTPNI